LTGRGNRFLRESQILECLPHTALDPDAIESRVYSTVAMALRPVATLTVAAHLEDLRDEARFPGP
jgi:hypothetical protein